MNLLRTADAIESIRQIISNRVLGRNVNLSLLETLKQPANLLNLLALRGVAFKKREEEKVRKFLADFFAGEIIEIADNNLDAEKVGDDKPDGRDNVARAKLRIDTRKWLMEQFSPSFYGNVKAGKGEKGISSLFRAKVYLPENGRS